MPKQIWRQNTSLSSGTNYKIIGHSCLCFTDYEGGSAGHNSYINNTPSSHPNIGEKLLTSLHESDANCFTDMTHTIER